MVCIVSEHSITPYKEKIKSEKNEIQKTWENR